MGSWGKPTLLFNIVMLVEVVGLWLWDNKWTILVTLAVGLTVGYVWRP